MDTIIGIDLGTTNSEVAVIKNGRPVVLEEDGDPILPSVVGLDQDGRMLVGRAARNQYVLAPERTVRSIKRKMGEDVRVRLGNKDYSPQEISAIILRSLKNRAEKELGTTVSKAVITVPAFFTEGQRQATREAGELAGLEVVRIINEPTAAVLTYDPNPPEMERLLVYDLGGGTFDVSIAQVENGVVEILSSRGDTRLGGDDFDQRIFEYLCDKFQSKHGIDLRDSLTAKSRVLRAAEDAKKQLSFDAVVTISEEFIAEKKGVPVHLTTELSRREFEDLIEPLLAKTLACVDQAMSDANLQAHQISKVVLVGGATRTPKIPAILEERLGRPVHAEVEPDLAVALGAAVQAGLIAGIDVGPVLVDITPRTLGIAILGEVNGATSIHAFSPIIPRNTPLPATRTEIYVTVADRQEVVEIRVFQGEDQDTRYNDLVGSFSIEKLAALPAGNQILVKLSLDLSGILKVTATERATGKSKHIAIDNAMERFRKKERVDALSRLDEAFASIDAASRTRVVEDDVELLDPHDLEDDELDDSEDIIIDSADEPRWKSPSASAAADASTSPTPSTFDEARALISKARTILPQAGEEDAGELRALITDLESAIAAGSSERAQAVASEVENLLFYLDDLA